MKILFVLAFALLASVNADSDAAPDAFTRFGLNSVAAYGNGFVGCYKDSDKRDLHFGLYSASMSRTTCQSHCVKTGYYYYAIQGGDSCYCGASNWVSSYGQVETTQCNTRCHGNSNQLCGGRYRNAVYYCDDNLYRNSILSSNQLGSGLNGVNNYYGCYLDQDINNLHFALKSSSMNYQTCQTTCVQKQYQYYSVKGGNSCYCGASNWRSSYGKVQDTHCSTSCYQSSNQVCGYPVYSCGSNVAHSSSILQQSQRTVVSSNQIGLGGVNTIGLGASTIGLGINSNTLGLGIDSNYNYYGCYLDQDINNLHFALKSSSMSYQTCQTHCVQQKYQYFTVKGGNSCYCGASNWAPSYGQLQQTQCSTSCYQSSNQVCGYPVYSCGNNVVSAHSSILNNNRHSLINNQLGLGINSNSLGLGIDSNYNYCGCYLDQDINNLHFALKSSSMSYQTCQTHCVQKQYQYFSVKGGNSCYCGGSNWVSSYGKVQDTHCSTSCYQSSNQVCGYPVYSCGSNTVAVVNNHQALINNQLGLGINSNSLGLGIDSNYNYYGCYLDQDINNLHFALKSSSMSYQTCQTHCVQQKYQYFSVKGGNSCYCGASNWVSSYGKLQQTQCSSSCYQSSNQVCGNSIYLVSNNNYHSSVINNNNVLGLGIDSNYNYYGCYLDQDINNLHFALKSSSMSYQTCQTHCVQKQYQYFTVKGGNSCYCGASNWVSSYGKLQQTQCSTSCYQSSNQVCGYPVYMCGNNNYASNVAVAHAGALNHHNSIGLGINSNSLGLGIDSNYNYYGCYLDQDINNLHFALKSSSMSYQTCQTHCVQKQYQYFSVKGGNSCYCGGSNWVSSYGKLQQTQCSTSCYQSSNQICGYPVYSCGNGYSNSALVQSSGLVAQPALISSGISNVGISNQAAYNYYGCYLDKNVHDLHFALKSPVMSYQICNSHCTQNNYQYFAVQSGDSCYCGASNWVSRYGRVHDSQCSTSCIGNTNQICGGNLRNSVYLVSNQGLVVSSRQQPIISQQYTGSYGLWQKYGSCVGGCGGKRGRQQYVRYCSKLNACNPSVKTVKYQSCRQIRGCRNKVAGLW